MPESNRHAAGFELKKLNVEHLRNINIPISKSIAVGDEENDQHMIKMAGLGVAMGNARESIKEIANYVTCSNNDHGVAKVIDKFILNR